MYKLILGLCLALLSSICQAQMGKQELNASFRGGSAAFLSYVTNNLEYPVQARGSGIVGTSIFSFKIDCRNNPTDIIFDTEMGYGVEKAITELLENSRVYWQSCAQRDENQTITLKISFSINGTSYAPSDAFVVINAMGNFKVTSDEHLVRQMEKALKKNKTEKSLKYLNRLIVRFPDNADYRKLKSTLLQSQ